MARGRIKKKESNQDLPTVSTNVAELGIVKKSQLNPKTKESNASADEDHDEKNYHDTDYSTIPPEQNMTISQSDNDIYEAYASFLSITNVYPYVAGCFYYTNEDINVDMVGDRVNPVQEETHE